MDNLSSHKRDATRKLNEDARLMTSSCRPTAQTSTPSSFFRQGQAAPQITSLRDSQSPLGGHASVLDQITPTDTANYCFKHCGYTLRET